MTRLAFYAPMKPPTHAIPSGDRTIARALMQALEMTGRKVDLASELRVYEKHGDPETQATLAAQAHAEIQRLIPLARDRGWRAWVTYHCYYKAPDLIGPAVARAVGLPYLLIEATRARKRLTGPWANFAAAAETACDAADAILYFTARDAVALNSHRTATQSLAHLNPFLPQTSLPDSSAQDGPMLSIGMMRPGDKLASYRLIADTLSQLRNSDWRLDIAGDGKARDEVAALMAPFGSRVSFLGLLDPTALHQAVAHASLMFWPGVNEAFGLVYLEAQAAGLPVVAQDRPGVREVLAPGPRPLPEDGTTPLAAQIDRLLADPTARQQAGKDARDHVAAHHLMGAAATTLDTTLRELRA